MFDQRLVGYNHGVQYTGTFGLLLVGGIAFIRWLLWIKASSRIHVYTNIAILTINRAASNFGLGASFARNCPAF